MSNSNRPPFQMAPRRCGRTEAMLNRVVENILKVGPKNPDLSTWDIVCLSAEQVKTDIWPRLMKKLDDIAGIEYRWSIVSTERIIVEIKPHGPNLLILATTNPGRCSNTKTFYDHAATEWHLREALWQLKEDSDACFSKYIRSLPSNQDEAIKEFKQEYLADWSRDNSAGKPMFEQEWLKRIAKEPNELLRDLPFTRVRGDDTRTYITTLMPETKWKFAPLDKEEVDGKADDSNKKND